MEWKNYINDRIIAKHSLGFFIIKPQKFDINAEELIPIFCPLCQFLMRSVYDEEAYNEFMCCDVCANNWVYQNIQKWKEGWRPSKEDIQNKINSFTDK